MKKIKTSCHGCKKTFVVSLEDPILPTHRDRDGKEECPYSGCFGTNEGATLENVGEVKE